MPCLSTPRERFTYLLAVEATAYSGLCGLAVWEYSSSLQDCRALSTGCLVYVGLSWVFLLAAAGVRFRWSIFTEAEWEATAAARALWFTPAAVVTGCLITAGMLTISVSENCSTPPTLWIPIKLLPGANFVIGAVWCLCAKAQCTAAAAADDDDNNSGPPPLPPAQHGPEAVEVAVAVIRRTEERQQWRRSSLCVICQEEIPADRGRASLAACRQAHPDAFHYKCLEKWVLRNPTCPICRGSALVVRP